MSKFITIFFTISLLLVLTIGPNEIECKLFDYKKIFTLLSNYKKKCLEKHFLNITSPTTPTTISTRQERTTTTRIPITTTNIPTTTPIPTTEFIRTTSEPEGSRFKRFLYFGPFRSKEQKYNNTSNENQTGSDSIKRIPRIFLEKLFEIKKKFYTDVLNRFKEKKKQIYALFSKFSPFQTTTTMMPSTTMQPTTTEMPVTTTMPTTTTIPTTTTLATTTTTEKETTPTTTTTTTTTTTDRPYPTVIIITPFTDFTTETEEY